MKIKKISMVLLFALGALELLVGIGMGFYPSLILGSCLLYGAVALKNRINKQQSSAAENAVVKSSFIKVSSRRKGRHSVKDYLIVAVFFLFAVIFICTALVTKSFPGIVVGVLFGFFGIKRILPDLNLSDERSDYHADDSNTIY